ncbi:IclR family transcriptional regulator C-terminal domain-containing protein [Bacillus sp. MUM 116]|uniref:IclR family transcriptional regulator domain-containing protein n=1 Tax=Bacillus sp. MUM 116 TaxID=1678002 RepID=UPI0009F62153
MIPPRVFEWISRFISSQISSVAAPIFNYKGSIIASISIAGLNVNYRKEMLPSLVEKVKSAVLEISRKFGYIPTT